MPERILLIDDEPHVLAALQRLLRQERPALKVECFSDPAAALERAREVSFALALSDYRMPGMNGVELLEQLRLTQPDCLRVILSAYADLTALLEAINRARIARFIAKPWFDDQLLRALDELLRERQHQIELRELAELERLRQGTLSPQDFERVRLERMEPGITHVDWGPNGEVLLAPLDPIPT